MFDQLEAINQRPRPFEFYTAADLWTQEHTSARMLEYHLNPEVDLSSRRGDFIARSIAWMGRRFGLGPGKQVADFGCGPGLYSSGLARLGAQVTGVDFSPRSLAHAREVAAQEDLSIDYRQGNYLDFETDQRFDLVCMIMCDFCALSPEQRGRMLAKFKRLLKPGGRVMLDVYSLAAFRARQEGASYQVNQLDGFWSPNKYYGFVNTFKYQDEKVTLDKYTIVEPGRSWTVYNWLQHFSPQLLAAEFAGAGLSVLEALGNVAGDPFEPDAPEFAVVAA